MVRRSGSRKAALSCEGENQYRQKCLRVRPWPELQPLFVMRRDACRRSCCVGMVPPAGLEPTHPAPEAGALSD